MYAGGGTRGEEGGGMPEVVRSVKTQASVLALPELIWFHQNDETGSQFLKFVNFWGKTDQSIRVRQS